MRYKVIQNVEREDRIIFFITMKQFVILLVGGGLTYSTYVNLAKTYHWEVWFLPTFLLGSITAAIAFLNIKDLDFVKLLFLIFERIMIPRRRIWVSGSDAFYIRSQYLKPREKAPDKDKNKERKMKTKSQLTELTHILDHGFDEHKAATSNEVDSQEIEDDDLLHYAFEIPKKEKEKKEIIATDSSTFPEEKKEDKFQFNLPNAGAADPKPQINLNSNL